MKKYSIKIIGLIIIYILFMLVIVSYSIVKNKRDIRDKSNIAFISAIEKERESFITNFNIRYNHEYSPDSVSVSEKIDWTLQAYLIMKDSCRYKLDSIFRKEIINHGLNLRSSISYTYNGKTTNSIKREIIEGTKIIHEKIYRKDYKKENDITLRAYVYLPLHVFIGNTTLHILILLNTIGLTVFILIKKYRKIQIKETVTHLEVETRTADDTKWIVLKNDIHWDEKNYIIKKGEKIIILRGESLKYFKLFIKNESFFLGYMDIYKSYGLKGEALEYKDRIYHSIKELKKDLIYININIKSVRGKGYQLTFN